MLLKKAERVIKEKGISALKIKVILSGYLF